VTPVEIAFVLVVSAIASLVKVVLGSGYPIIVIPAVALFLTVEDAVVIMAPANLALNIVIAAELGHLHRHSPELGRFVVSSMVGAVIGALVLPVLPDRFLRLVLVGVVGLFIANRWRRTDRRLDPSVAHRYTPVVGGVAGLFQGATGVSGPIVAPWYLSLGLDRDTFVYSVAVVYGLSSAAQLVALGTQQLFTTERLILSLVLIPLALVVAPLGSRLRGRLEPVAFERMVVVVLAVSALSLAVRSF
jgi:uncharacterized membrane protein YfcA